MKKKLLIREHQVWLWALLFCSLPLEAMRLALRKIPENSCAISGAASVFTRTERASLAKLLLSRNYSQTRENFNSDAALARSKKFCVAGPIIPEIHYYVPHRLNKDHLLDLIQSGEYFVFHAPRQSGKTTEISLFVRELNDSGIYTALYINIEAAQAARDTVEKALITIINIIAREIEHQLPECIRIAEQLVQMVAQQPVSLDLLTRALNVFALKAPRPVVLFIDEIDALIGDSLLSVLRQIRAGFKDRPTRFPLSICLIGLRDVRDYRVWSKQQGGVYVSTSSPFNIKAESLTIANFSLNQVLALYHQHTENTGQSFNNDAVEYAHFLTQGQPWLVNALAYQACFREMRDRSVSITKPMIEDAKNKLIMRRDTHIDSLVDKLSEERVIPIIDAIVSGEESVSQFRPDDVKYLRDLGLIAPGSFDIANPIYKEIIPRELTWVNQERIQPEGVFYKNADGSLNFSLLMKAFTQFFRENSEFWLKGESYKESGPHLLLMAFLQRIINGGGSIQREYALGRKRVDLLIRWGKQKIAVEIKLRHGESTLVKGLEQAADYVDRSGADEGHLVIVDRESEKTWEEKISTEEMIYKGKKITVWTM